MVRERQMHMKEEVILRDEPFESPGLAFHEPKDSSWASYILGVLSFSI